MSCKFFTAVPVLLAMLVPVASAAVISPQLGGFIDPAGGGEWDADATGSVPLATFEALSDKVIQANWQGISGTGGNTIDHADVDVRINHSPGFAATPNSAAAFNSASAGTGYQWSGTNGQQLEILFGTQDGGFTPDRTVQAAGMMLMNFGGAYPDVTITYLDSTDGVLSTQNFSGGGDPEGNGADVFTGYNSSSANIARITVDITRTSAGSGSSNIALDALTYVAIPEPSSVALLALLGVTAGLVGPIRRRG